ncbi:MAG: acyl carrier protein [Acutalibacteraceae bacterium]|jgi:acyl carrier protein|nr:acyl carrier protein [Clostridiales bacterium]
MIFEKIKEIICEQLEVDEKKVTMESSLIDDLGADSLDLIDLVMSIEDEYDVEVPDDMIESIKTIGDVVKFIEENK